MSVFLDLVAEHASEDYVETASAVLAALRVRPAAAEVLLPIVANSVRHVFRETSRRAEYSADTAHPDVDTTSTRTNFLRLRFAIGDGRWVAWGEATVDDHMARVTMLAALRNGIELTINRHLNAIEQIESAGVTCLDEIEEAAA